MPWAGGRSPLPKVGSHFCPFSLCPQGPVGAPGPVGYPGPRGVKVSTASPSAGLCRGTVWGVRRCPPGWGPPSNPSVSLQGAFGVRGLKGSKGEKVRGVGERGQQGTGVLVLCSPGVPGVGGHSSLPCDSWGGGTGHAWAAAVLGFGAQPHTVTPSGICTRANTVAAPPKCASLQGEDGFPGFKGDMGPKGDRVSGVPPGDWWGSPRQHCVGWL